MNEINNQLRKLLYAKLIGDGHLQKQDRTKPRFYFKHKEEDCCYVYEQIAFLQSLGLEFEATCPRHIKTYDKRTEKYYYAVEAVSLGYSLLGEIYDDWYNQNGKKKLPIKKLKELMDEEVLAIWYQDDGNLTIDKGNNHSRIVLSTDGFTKQDVNALIQILDKKFGISGNLEGYTNKENKKKWRITFSTKRQVMLFLSCVEPYISHNMGRKNFQKQSVQEDTMKLFLKENQTKLKKELSQRTLYLSASERDTLHRKDITSPLLNKNLEEFILRELISVQLDTNRRKRIFHFLKDDTYKITKEEKVQYGPILSEFVASGFDVLKQWTGLDFSDYFRIYLNDTNEMRRLEKITQLYIALKTGTPTTTVSSYINKYPEYFEVVLIGESKYYLPSAIGLVEEIKQIKKENGDRFPHIKALLEEKGFKKYG